MKIGIFGFGNLGKSFTAGLIKSGVNQCDICINAKTQKTMDLVNEKYTDITVYREKENVVEFSDILVLIVEPKNVDVLCREISTCNLENKIILSFISGISISEIYARIGIRTGRYDVIRAIPNIAISKCNGIIGVAAHEIIKEKSDAVITLLKRLGTVIEVKEEDLERITVTAACGLAFASVLMKAYQDSIDILLKDEEMAKEITLKVFDGVTSIVSEGNISFEQLNSIIATKGGSTEVGLVNMNIKTINAAVTSAITAAYDRTQNVGCVHKD